MNVATAVFWVVALGTLIGVFDYGLDHDVLSSIFGGVCGSLGAVTGIWWANRRKVK